MDFHLKQWGNQQHESEQSPSAKMPKLLIDDPCCQQPSQQQQPQPQPSSGSAAALPLFAPEPNTKISNLSAFPEPNTAATTRFPTMGSHFSLAQWQELELQALIYRYMLAGISVPPELLQSIKKSLLQSPQYFLHHHPLQHYSHYQPSLWQTGYCGRVAMDPEPGRCRRTDGKKWRCSRDVVAGQKYCERHVHRGRNRSRKPVEIPTPISSAINTNGSGGGVGGAACGGGVGVRAAFNAVTPAGVPSFVAGANGNKFSVSGQSPSTDLLHLNQSTLDSKTENKGFLGRQNDVGTRSDGHILRHFFDDWPRPLQEPENAGRNGNPMTNSATCLSISMPGNSPSDVSLKLSTGSGEEAAAPTRGNEREQLHLMNWGAGWGANQVASMGGPLAEALRSSTTNSSPTSVLHQLSRCSASETSYVST